VSARKPLGLALVALLLAAACSEPTSGPVRVVWGRHACDHCGMLISEPRFAAQVRLGPREVARFDDFGCAALWLDAHGGAAAAREFWAMDAEGDEWLDARRAFYRAGQRTPMAYGLAALREREPGALDFEGALGALRERERERASKPRS
jgi:nitrous oxide reductase accessory protein NosL